MSDEVKTFSSSLVLDLRIWWRHVHTLYSFAGLLFFIAELLVRLTQRNWSLLLARYVFWDFYDLKLMKYLCQKCKKNGGHRLRLGENKPEKSP